MINKRLKAIASLVDKNKKIIDVGCDHALLDIYLTLYNSNICIASDINKNALENAKKNIKKYNLENKIETRLQNGIVNIEDDIDIIIISGMGTKTILDILKNNKNVNKLIISSNNDYFELRKNLMKKYHLTKEEAVLDKNKYYLVMKFELGKTKYNYKQLFLGPILISKKDSVTKLYYEYLYNKKINILNKLPRKYIFKIIKLKREIKYLKIKLENF